MALALNFRTSSDVSAKLLLTVLSHFGKETDASRVAFLKGPPETASLPSPACNISKSAASKCASTPKCAQCVTPSRTAW